MCGVCKSENYTREFKSKRLDSALGTKEDKTQNPTCSVTPS